MLLYYIVLVSFSHLVRDLLTDLPVSITQYCFYLLTDPVCAELTSISRFRHQIATLCSRARLVLRPPEQLGLLTATNIALMSDGVLMAPRCP